mmetsp:Transcript_18577/g.57091  ORF Transcript_18577/g.57091 Transcript_18577/m.57091 type:complete len:259 (+) Transcript_18577:1497-2273(+)
MGGNNTNAAPRRDRNVSSEEDTSSKCFMEAPVVRASCCPRSLPFLLLSFFLSSAPPSPFVLRRRGPSSSAYDAPTNGKRIHSHTTPRINNTPRARRRGWDLRRRGRGARRGGERIRRGGRCGAGRGRAGGRGRVGRRAGGARRRGAKGPPHGGREATGRVRRQRRRHRRRRRRRHARVARCLPRTCGARARATEASSRLGRDRRARRDSHRLPRRATRRDRARTARTATDRRRASSVFGASAGRWSPASRRSRSGDAR